MSLAKLLAHYGGNKTKQPSKPKLKLVTGPKKRADYNVGKNIIVMDETVNLQTMLTIETIPNYCPQNEDKAIGGYTESQVKTPEQLAQDGFINGVYVSTPARKIAARIAQRGRMGTTTVGPTAHDLVFAEIT